MSSRTSQRVVYVVTAAIVASMIAGFALANLSLGSTNNGYQGSQTTNVSSLPGLTWLATQLSGVNSSTVYTAPCTTPGGACVVGTTAIVLCVGSFSGAYGTSSCGDGDFVEEITLTTVLNTLFYGVTAPVTVGLTVYLTGAPPPGIATPATYAGPAFYVQETASPGASNVVHIVLDFDVGTDSSGPGLVSSISVVATT